MTLFRSDLTRNLGIGFLAGTVMVAMSNNELVIALAAIIA